MKTSFIRVYFVYPNRQNKEKAMTKRKKIILLIIVLAVIAGIAYGVNAMSGGSVISAPLASPQTKLALNKNFSKELDSHLGIPDGSTPITIQAASSNCSANVLVYVLYACQDYQAGHISKSQLLEVMKNTKGSIDYLTDVFNKNNKIVMTYPIINQQQGPCYTETEPNGVQNYNTKNYVELQPKIFDLINQMYQEQDPDKIYLDLQEIGVMYEQSTFYYSENMQFGMDKITTAQFKPTWIISYCGMTADSVQKTLEEQLH